MQQNLRPRANHATSFFAIFFMGLLSSGSSVGADSVFDLADYRGEVVVLDFWASWCVPCRRSFPWLNQMQQKYGEEGLVVVGVNMDASADDAQAFLDDFPAKFKIIYDQDGVLARQFDVVAMPSSYVIDRNGDIVANHLGFKVKKQDEYELLIKETLHSKRD